MELSGPKINKFLITLQKKEAFLTFSHKKAYLYFGKWNFLKKNYENYEKISYILRNGTF